MKLYLRTFCCYCYQCYLVSVINASARQLQSISHLKFHRKHFKSNKFVETYISYLKEFKYLTEFLMYNKIRQPKDAEPFVFWQRNIRSLYICKDSKFASHLESIFFKKKFNTGGGGVNRYQAMKQIRNRFD